MSRWLKIACHPVEDQMSDCKYFENTQTAKILDALSGLIKVVSKRSRFARWQFHVELDAQQLLSSYDQSDLCIALA